MKIVDPQTKALGRALPQQLWVRRIPHLALIAGRIRVKRIQVLHVWLPLFRQDVLQLLYLPFSGKLQHYVIQ